MLLLKKVNISPSITATPRIYAAVLSLTLFFGQWAALGQSAESSSPTEAVEMLKDSKPRPPWVTKLHYGGNFWIGLFGSFYVDVEPMVGYEVGNAGTIAGLGATFIYQGQFQGQSNWVAGPRIFVRQPIWRSVFAHVEYELMNATENNFYSFYLPPGGVTELKRKWEGSPLVGLGFYQGRQRQQGGSFLSVMYNAGFPNRGFINPQRIGGGDSPFVLRFGIFI